MSIRTKRNRLAIYESEPHGQASDSLRDRRQAVGEVRAVWPRNFTAPGRLAGGRLGREDCKDSRRQGGLKGRLVDWTRSTRARGVSAVCAALTLSFGALTPEPPA